MRITETKTPTTRPVLLLRILWIVKYRKIVINICGICSITLSINILTGNVYLVALLLMKDREK